MTSAWMAHALLVMGFFCVVTAMALMLALVVYFVWLVVTGR